MKQLLILSGKGGTGKTTVAGALIKLSQARAYTDCDVDAPNLHLSMTQTGEAERNDYYGMPKAQIDTKACIGCGQCADRCPMNNITIKAGRPVWGNECTHCMACICYCPPKAIEYGKKSVGKPRYHFEQLGSR